MKTKNIYYNRKTGKELIKLLNKNIEYNKNRIKEIENGCLKGDGILYNEDIVRINKEFIIRDEKRIKEIEEEIKEMEEKLKEMFKYFSPKTDLKKGQIYKLLTKKYVNPFNSDDFKGYSKELWEIINYAIDNNKDFYLQFKTLINNCTKVYDNDLKKWV